LAIDFHAHWIPQALAKGLRARPAVPRIESMPTGEDFVSWQGRMPAGPLLDLEARAEFMDRHGVEMQVLSLAGLFGVDCLPARESMPLVTAFNDAAASLGERFAALAALPLADLPLACRELERAHALGLRGAILPADAFASLAVAERFRPLFEVANHLNCHFFIHPGPLEPQPERHLRGLRLDSAWERRIVLETQARLSDAVVTLCLSGFLDAYPDVSIHVANLGGAIPFLVERMEEVRRAQMNEPEPPSRRLGRCYVDTASFGSRGIEMAVACFGRERVLFGSDCPVFDTGRMLACIGAARLDADTQRLILAGNAQRLLNPLCQIKRAPAGAL
jgi:predicted TIM-barrel fold metal-dependent hydrolase